MSTILDALRKSEQERNRNKIPTLNDMVAPQEPSRWPLFLVAAVILLTGALGVLAYVIWSSSEQFHQSGNVIVKNVSSSSTAPSIVVSGEGVASSSSEPVAEPGLLASPVSVSIVSYSENDELRFAIVNGKTVREGDFVRTGLKVEKISAGSVLFNQRGKTFEYKP